MKSLFIAKRVVLGNIPMLFVIMAMALAFTLIFGNIMTANSGGNAVYDIALIMEADEDFAADLQQGLMENPRLRVTVTGEAEARKQVRQQKVLLALYVDDTFNMALAQNRAPEVTILRDAESTLFTAARQEIEREIKRITVAITAANHLAADGSREQWRTAYAETLEEWKTPPVAVHADVLGAAQPDSGWQMDRVGIGFTVMFIMITVITASGAVLDERNRGTWQRVLTAPVSRRAIVGGYLLSYFALGWLQFFILVVAGRLINGVHWGNPLGVAILTTVFLLCSISLGLVIAGIARTYQQQQAVSTLVVTATSMLGGLFWPLDIVGPTMQTIARATPQYWAMNGYEQILSHGLDWFALREPIFVLLAFTVVFFLFGVSRIQFE
ncbi:MAG: ABC transporter permease [Bacillota bacterium]|nr:ABC transporter permease [Bacillota bacterium]MDW7683631.1 ABC transporter permease [Bacillota bacterium]